MEKFKNPIPYMKHQITDDDIDLVNKALKSDYITQGPMVLKVEEEMSKLTDKSFSVMCSNGTAALHLVAEMLSQKFKYIKQKYYYNSIYICCGHKFW